MGFCHHIAGVTCPNCLQTPTHEPELGKVRIVPPVDVHPMRDRTLLIREPDPSDLRRAAVEILCEIAACMDSLSPRMQKAIDALKEALAR